ncbi:viomycin phosphotransferase [Streptomyces sp. UNOB3_S3]|uniref:viomycin phosphotransferase n=1 Tax=Streptomyces sp. UNOB3_S3 TaxID=2871682 RepID=UPI001E48412F|nr:viomycin phosphotransferase [Streptomyces sp. UNOB3_S3]
MDVPDVLQEHRALLERLLPGDRAGELVVHRGQFHQVVIGRTRVVCFARTAAAAARLPRRAAVLRALAGAGLGFRTPELLEEGPAHLVLGRIPGAPLGEAALAAPGAADAVAGQYAALLAGLAAAGSDERVRAALPGAPEGGWRAFADGVRAELFPLMSATGRERAGRELAALDALPHLTTAVVHGDLGRENVLWDTSGGLPRLSGVVDWDEVSLGDPAEDLAAIGAGHGEELLRRVIGLRGPDEGVGERVAAVRGTFALQQALYARRDGDEEELADGLAGYRRP